LELLEWSAVSFEDGSMIMGLAKYEITGEPGEWHVLHDGRAPNTYETKEAAFEAAIAAASVALRQGHEVIVTAPSSHGSEPTTGARESN
jgi:hypothetical protein